MNRLPVRLKKDPILEAVFEIRFVGISDSVADLLPGLLYGDLKPNYGNVIKIPAYSQIPREIIKADPRLKHVALYQFEDKTNGSKIQIGDRVFTLNMAYPYPGWQQFCDLILRLVNNLKDTDVIEQVERFSLKYINQLWEVKGKQDLSMLKFNATLGDYDLVETGCLLRTEISKNDFINIVQVMPNVSTAFSSGVSSRRGLLLEIDTISTKPMDNFWTEIKNDLEMAHNTEKSIFFSLLTEESIRRFEPEWSKQ